MLIVMMICQKSLFSYFFFHVVMMFPVSEITEKRLYGISMESTSNHYVKGVQYMSILLFFLCPSLCCSLILSFLILFVLLSYSLTPTCSGFLTSVLSASIISGNYWCDCGSHSKFFHIDGSRWFILLHTAWLHFTSSFPHGYLQTVRH